MLVRAEVSLRNIEGLLRLLRLLEEDSAEEDSADEDSADESKAVGIRQIVGLDTVGRAGL